MKKRIIALMTAAALAFSITGCEIDTSEEGSTETKRTIKETEITGWKEEVKFYTDPDTGVQYLIFKLGDNYIIQPRYKPDGSIKTID